MHQQIKLYIASYNINNQIIKDFYKGSLDEMGVL